MPEKRIKREDMFTTTMGAESESDTVKTKGHLTEYNSKVAWKHVCDE
jgi:hypothetical protein